MLPLFLYSMASQDVAKVIDRFAKSKQRFVGTTQLERREIRPSMYRKTIIEAIKDALHVVNAVIHIAAVYQVEV